MSFMKYTVEWYADLFKETEIEADNKAALSKAKKQRDTIAAEWKIKP